MNYGKKHDLPFGIMDVAGLLRLNIRRRAPGQVYVDCPICGDRRGKMNLNTVKDLWRCNYCGEGGGMLSLYAKVYGVSNSDAYREICDALAVNGFSPDYTVPEKTTPAEAEQSDAASVQEVHQTLSMLLSMLTLIPAHHTHLQSVRGLSDDEITRFGFKSTPPPFLCRSLTNRLVKAGCRVQGVPGFYVDDNGCWTVKFHQRTSGIIIPIFGVDGLIRGAQIRLDHPLKDKDDPPEKTGVKYLTLSSTGKRMGTTSGSPIHFVGDPCSRVVYVTEGCLKADVAHALMHRTFVATLGANNTAKLDELFAFLHRNGTEEIIEAEDMDKYSNEMVGKGASKIYALAARHGMRCRRLTWNPNYKGIDDWQLALRRKEQKMKEDPGMTLYGDNVFEKDGIRRDRTGDGEKTRCLCGKRGIFNRDGPAMGPQIIRQLERRASRRSASFFHALASPGRPRNGGGASGAYQPAEGRKALIQGRFRAQEGPLGPSRKSQQQTKRTGFAALEDSIADEAPEGKRAKRANRALNRAGINSRGQKQGFGGADRRGGRVTSR